MDRSYTFHGRPKEIVGYASPLSARPGETIDFKAHSARPYHAALVRFVDVPKDVADEDFATHVACPEIAATYPSQLQRTLRGSYLELPTPQADLGDRWILSLNIHPTLPDSCTRTRETVLDWGSDSGPRVILGIDQARRTFVEVVDHAGERRSAKADIPLARNNWYHVQLAASTDGLTLTQKPSTHWLPTPSNVSLFVPTDSTGLQGARMLIARQAEEDCPWYYNGKVDAVSLVDSHAAPVVSWDFSLQPHTATVEDVGPHRLRGRVHRLPTRAAAGVSWNGKQSDMIGTASRTAIHFHEGDLEDADWATSFSLTVPEDLDSGAYAMRLEADGDVDYVPFFVAPPITHVVPRDRVAVVIPTYTYTAYANMHTDVFDGTMDPVLNGKPPELCAEEEYIQRMHEELLGLSLYDPHVDGNSTIYSTRRRPLLHVRPHYRLWKTGLPRGFSADLILLGWLRRQGIDFDILTDEQVDFDDNNPLERYRAVLTGDHPEYVTRVMRDRFESYIANGGRVAYLGGNGFCWVTSSSRERPYFVEVRRGHGGSGGSPNSLAGEEVHSLTGEQGGAWGFRGLTSQKLIGVGTTACGWVSAPPFVRTEASRSGIGRKIFAGLDGHDLIGANAGFPGIAGDEIDRADLALGTPATTVVLASSAGLHDEYYYGLNEDYQPYDNAGVARGQTKIRADMAVTCNPNGGAVFSASSVAWILGLREGLDDQTVAAVTRNVINLLLSEDVTEA